MADSKCCEPPPWASSCVATAVDLLPAPSCRASSTPRHWCHARNRRRATPRRCRDPVLRRRGRKSQSYGCKVRAPLDFRPPQLAEISLRPRCPRELRPDLAKGRPAAAVLAFAGLPATCSSGGEIVKREGKGARVAAQFRPSRPSEAT